MLAEADRVVAEFEDPDSLHSERALVEACIVQWALEELGTRPTA